MKIFKTFSAYVALLSISMHTWSNCSIYSNGLLFGIYDVFDLHAIDRVGRIDVQCREDTIYTLKMAQGSGSYVNRFMLNQQNRLYYNLYSDASYSMIWGDGTNGTVVRNGGGSTQYFVYGRIFPRQNVSVGVYSDVVLVTLEY